MKFFTDKTVINDYLLIKIQDYFKLGNNNYKEIFIDPGVYELTKSNEYSWFGKIDIKEFLNSLPANCFFTCDYPSDMNLQYTDLFLTKSWTNAIKYCNDSQYIVSAQYKQKDIYSFKYWFDKYNNLPIKSGIIGLGNICRIHYLTEYIKECLKYAFENSIHPRIHIYGLGMRIIVYANKLAIDNNIELSIDSTKWTRAVNSELKWTYGYNCKKDTRQLFFDTYLDSIEKRGVQLQ